MPISSLSESTANGNKKKKCNPRAELVLLLVLLLIGGLAFLFLRQIDSPSRLAGNYEGMRAQKLDGPTGERIRPQKLDAPPGVLISPQDLGVSQTAVVDPKLFPADQVSIPGNVEVIGIEVDGKTRAYVVRELEEISRHVINDRLDNVPVSVTYCNLADCVKVFSGDAGDRPLDIRVAGYENAGGMVLHIKGNQYYQKSGRLLHDAETAEIPYPELPYERTTWTEWRDDHPDTLVYVGREAVTGAWRSVFPARMVQVDDEAEVIGLSVNGNHRAYLVEALQDFKRHVLLDGLSDNLFAVTFCENKGLAKAFAAPSSADFPDIAFAGWDTGADNGGMFLEFGGKLYFQATGEAVDTGNSVPFPFSELPMEHTTWKEWSVAHPDTTVFVGNLQHVRRYPSPRPEALGWSFFLHDWKYALAFAPAAVFFCMMVSAHLFFRSRNLFTTKT